MDKKTCLEKQRQYRKLTGNRVNHKYEKTKNGFLMRLYRNMKSRVTGVQYKKAHLYLGKELLLKEEFYKWANGSVEFDVMWSAWVSSSYNRKLCPTVDRINADGGYIISNMQWLTHSQNSAKIRHWSRKI